MTSKLNLNEQRSQTSLKDEPRTTSSSNPESSNGSLEEKEKMKICARFLLVCPPTTQEFMFGGQSKATVLLTSMSKTPLPSVPSSPSYIIRQVPGRGTGLVATRALKSGTIVLAEAPFVKLRWPIQPISLDEKVGLIRDKLSDKSEEDKRAFDSLHISKNQLSVPKSLGIFRTNAMDCTDGNTAVFLVASRLNHSCQPTLVRTWVEEEGKEYFVTVRDVAEGEELTMSYVDSYNPKAERRSRLLQDYDFLCHCPSCSLPPSESERLDKVGAEIQAKFKILTNAFLTEPLDKLHELCCQGVQLHREAKINSFLELEFAHSALMVNVLLGCRPLVKIWIEELFKLSKRYGIVGKDRIDRFRFYEIMKEDPTCHPAWAVYSKE
ncbi:hypothetical protein JCM3765_001942 [Sporobolomyces pararoseus]